MHTMKTSIQTSSLIINHGSLAAVITMFFTLSLNPCCIKQLICQVTILSIEFEDIIDLNERKAKYVPVINYLRGGPVVDLWPGWLESNYRLNFHLIATFN